MIRSSSPGLGWGAGPPVFKPAHPRFVSPPGPHGAPRFPVSDLLIWVKHVLSGERPSPAAGPKEEVCGLGRDCSQASGTATAVTVMTRQDPEPQFDSKMLRRVRNQTFDPVRPLILASLSSGPGHKAVYSLPLVESGGDTNTCFRVEDHTGEC